MVDMTREAVEMAEPRIRVKKSRTRVFIEIDGKEYGLGPYLAREVGDAMYKAGCDVAAGLENEEKQK